MTELLKAWALFTVSLGCWTGLTLLLSRRGERRARLTMAAFVGLLLLPALNAYVTWVRGQPWPPLLALSVHLTWAYGPLLVMCVRQALRLPDGLSRWHAAPLVIVSVAAVLGRAEADSLPLLALLAAQVLVYVAIAVWELGRHRHRLSLLTGAHATTSHYWLLFLAGGLAATSVYDLVLLALIRTGHAPPLDLLLGAALLLGLYVDLIALFAVYQPEIFIGDRADEPDEAPEPERPPAVRAVELTSGAAHELQQRLFNVAVQHKPHLDDEISLTKLAGLMDVTPHQLSELLNVHLGTSFYDYLNDQRHAEALALLTQNHPVLTVADVAYRAGFNNRNSFYKVFKDKTGTTPAEYRSALRKRA
jgi:AraC-like DNA-binding protein